MSESAKNKPRTSSAVKRRYNNKAYDRITLFVPVGDKEKISEYAQSIGKTMSGFIKDLISDAMNQPKSKK